MTGKFVIGKKSEAKDKHCMVSLEINNDILNFIDVRKFATIHLLKTSETNKHSYIKTLGVDPVLKAFTNSTLKKLINTSSKMNIKSFLLDQSKIAGIGNIYASEILFKAKISPLRINNTLNEKEILNIYKAIKNILAEAIISRGTTFSDYRDGFNRKGSYQNKLRVYNKYNEACQTCGTLINKIKQNGRSTFYCSNCQK
jgi:formamidopyrimidine-DNA glycosylase